MSTTPNSIDKRILNLSYSSLLTLHTCPRKLQLYKLQTKIEFEEDPSSSQSVTFAYGHVIGTGIQNLFSGLTLNETIWQAFLQWSPDLFAENSKQKKSFWECIHALRQFHHMRSAGYLEGYELVSYEGKKAAELSFSITLPDGFIYRGFVDAVLQHSETKEVIVLECKTTASATVNPAQYKNSAQAIGYSIVLDAIFPELSSYKVLYLVYQSKSQEYIQFPFEKTYYQRALWIQELLLDVETIKLYEGAGIYPMHGESCYSFFRECEYLNICGLSTSLLTSPLTESEAAKIDSELAEYQIKISITDLIQAQLAKDKDTKASSARSSEDYIL